MFKSFQNLNFLKFQNKLKIHPKLKAIVKLYLVNSNLNLNTDVVIETIIKQTSSKDREGL